MSWFEALCARDDEVLTPKAADDQCPCDSCLVFRDRHRARLAIEALREALRRLPHPHLGCPDETRCAGCKALALLDAETPPQGKE